MVEVLGRATACWDLDGAAHPRPPGNRVDALVEPPQRLSSEAFDGVGVASIVVRRRQVVGASEVGGLLA